LADHARFLVNYAVVMEFDSGGQEGEDKKAFLGGDTVPKPKLETRQFKSHTMDNVRVRRMCDELLHLEDQGHVLSEDSASKSNRVWMRTLQMPVGKHVHCLKMSSNPEVSIGGYFIISQMLSYTQGLVSLDLSNNDLTAAEARVLSLGMKSNRSVQVFKLRDNSVASEGATSLAEMLKVNSTMMVLDLRANNIRGAGICVLADSMSENTTLTQLDVRWNYVGESSDFVEAALMDLNRFCGRNRTGVSQLFKRLSSDKTGHDDLFSEEGGSLREALELERRQSEDPLNYQSLGSSHSGGGSDPPHSSANRPDVASFASSGRKESSAGSSNDPSKAQNNNARERTRSMSATDASISTVTSNQQQNDLDCIGRLEVTILEAKNLPQVIWSSGKDGEFLGLPQAYVVFVLNKQMTQTSINKRDWSPKWDYTFSIDVRDVWQVCSIKVMHSKRRTRTHRDDYTIGNVSLPVGGIINWRGVTLGLDGTFRAYHRAQHAASGTIYTVCKAKDRSGEEKDRFQTAVEAASAYDEVARKIDREAAILNFAADEAHVIGQHVKEELYPLSGEDGISVMGVQAGVRACVHLRLKYFMNGWSYLEVHLDRATALPKMDAGLGSCDAYCMAHLGAYAFKSKLTRNSLDPQFNQTFRVEVKQEDEPIELRVSVWDWDRFYEDDHMGDVVIKFIPKEAATGGLDKAYAVTKANGEGLLRNSRGQTSELHLRFSYFPAATNTLPTTDSGLASA